MLEPHSATNHPESHRVREEIRNEEELELDKWPISKAMRVDPPAGLWPIFKVMRVDPATGPALLNTTRSYDQYGLFCWSSVRQILIPRHRDVSRNYLSSTVTQMHDPLQSTEQLFETCKTLSELQRRVRFHMPLRTPVQLAV